MKIRTECVYMPAKKQKKTLGLRIRASKLQAQKRHANGRSKVVALTKPELRHLQGSLMFWAGVSGFGICQAGCGSFFGVFLAHITLERKKDPYNMNMRSPIWYIIPLK